MIIELYTFSPSSYVVAEEWNANFKVLYKESYAHTEAIIDAFNNVAFAGSDLSGIYNSIRSRQNSFHIATESNVYVKPEREYYKTLSTGERLQIHIEQGLNAESRIMIRVQEDRSVEPFDINYSGVVKKNTYHISYTAGYYCIMIYETNNVAQIKVIKLQS